MANVQRYFEKFHFAIRADYDSDTPLREKRDGILKLLKDRLKEAERPSFRRRLQGSYEMRTGVKPIEDLEYDIDVGLRFDLDDGVTSADVRSWIYEAVKNKTKSVEEKSPCIRVGYAAGYHVDLVVYHTTKKDTGEETYKLGHKDGWRPTDPPKLSDHFSEGLEKFSAVQEDSQTNTNQLRRLVRYLKRWGDEAIPSVSKRKPSGLAYTLLVIKHGSPTVDDDGEPDDLEALKSISAKLAKMDRIAADKPSPEYEDVLGGLSETAMSELKGRFVKLEDALSSAQDEADPVVACETLHGVFGRDFPIPDPEDTGKKTKAPAIVKGSSSA